MTEKVKEQILAIRDIHAGTKKRCLDINGK